MSNKKYTVSYTIKGKDNLLKDYSKNFSNEQEVIDFTKTLKVYDTKESQVIGKPIIICN